jgi:hypothetical protein
MTFRAPPCMCPNLINFRPYPPVILSWQCRENNVRIYTHKMFDTKYELQLGLSSRQTLSPERWGSKHPKECDNLKLAPKHIIKNINRITSQKFGYICRSSNYWAVKTSRILAFCFFSFILSRYNKVPRIFCRSLGLHSLQFFMWI